MANATQFVPTNIFRGEKIEEDSEPLYEVHEQGRTWGYVSGAKGQFRAISQHAFSWGPNRRTRAQAVEAAKTAELMEPVPDIPGDAIKYRVTEHNLHEVIKPGVLIAGATDLGPVVSVRLTNDRYRNALVVGTEGRDVLGLPSTVHIVHP